jgi:hypothetical protein
MSNWPFAADAARPESSKQASMKPLKPTSGGALSDAGATMWGGGGGGQRAGKDCGFRCMKTDLGHRHEIFTVLHNMHINDCNGGASSSINSTLY